MRDDLIEYAESLYTDEEYEQIKNGTYPLYDGTIRNKKIVPVLGANEFNHFSLTKNHVNGFWLEGTTGSGYAGMENEYGFEQVIKFIDENGGLLLRYSDGSEGLVNTGEVSVRGMYDYL